MLSLIKEELTEIRDRYGDERRTQITFAEDDLDIEDLIQDRQMVITITKSGYIKSLPLATYRQQRRGGVGVTGMAMKDEDYIEHLFVCSTHDYLLFFTNRGKVYRSKVYDLPDAPSRQSKGRHLGNVLPLREGERVQSVLATRDYSEARYLMFATRCGTVKKTELQAYNTPIKADGIIAINIRDGDELVAVRRVDEGEEVLMVSRAGLTVRFSEADARAMGRDTSGVRGMDVGRDGEVIAMDIARDDQFLLVVTENGFGKRTLVGDYRKTSRGAKGVKTIQQTEAKGALAAALVVRDHHQLVFISQNGMVQRIAVRELRPLGRNAQGFRLMNVRDDDVVSAVALVVESEATAAAAGDGPVSIDAGGAADEPALEDDGVVIGDPDEDTLLVPARGRVRRDARLRPARQAPSRSPDRPQGRVRRGGLIRTAGCGVRANRRGSGRRPVGSGLTTEGPVDTGPSVHFLLDYLAVASCLSGRGDELRHWRRRRHGVDSADQRVQHQAGTSGRAPPGSRKNCHSTSDHPLSLVSAE